MRVIRCSKSGCAKAPGSPKLSLAMCPIVPMTLELNQEERQLIVSGPNTGGKTVALKTVGLLSMMAQAGIPVPAREAVFPLFTAYFRRHRRCAVD